MARKLIFLHGWTMRGAIFDDLISRLQPEFDCVAPDLPGHGSAAAAPPTLSACADTLGEILAKEGAEAPVVIGWSMGAAAAWTYVAQYGTTGIGALVTVDMSPKIVSNSVWPYGLIGQTEEKIAATTDRFKTDWEGATHSIAATMFARSDGPPNPMRVAAREVILAQSPDKMRDLWDDLVAMDQRTTIGQIDIPYLVCNGAKSRVYPGSVSDWILAVAPMARRVTFQQSGHSPHLEEPAAFADAIAEFAKEI